MKLPSSVTCKRDDKHFLEFGASYIKFFSYQLYWKFIQNTLIRLLRFAAHRQTDRPTAVIIGIGGEAGGCGEITESRVTPLWPKSRYEFLFYLDAKDAYQVYVDLVCKQKLVHKIASNQPL